MVTLTVHYEDGPVRIHPAGNAAEARRELVRITRRNRWELLGSGRTGVLIRGAGANARPAATYAIT